MWNFVSGLLKDPECIQHGIEALIREVHQGSLEDLATEIEVYSGLQ